VKFFEIIWILNFFSFLNWHKILTVVNSSSSSGHLYSSLCSLNNGTPSAWWFACFHIEKENISISKFFYLLHALASSNEQLKRIVYSYYHFWSEKMKKGINNGFLCALIVRWCNCFSLILHPFLFSTSSTTSTSGGFSQEQMCQFFCSSINRINDHLHFFMIIFFTMYDL
jgi:hypothetical protein